MNTQYTTPEEFKDIAPIDDCEFQQRMSQLVKEPGFEHAIKYAMPDVNFPEFARGLCQIDNKTDFQIKNSSQSTANIQSLEAFEAAKFLAALKSFIHSKSKTLSVYFSAISRVLSVEPVSTNTISQS